MKIKVRLVAATLLAVFLSTANAWDGTAQGVITNIDVVGGSSPTGSYDVRVVLAGVPLLCSGGVGWAYINAADPNYQTLTAALMVAKTTGTQVTLYTIRESNGYCHIGYVSMQ